ncbi:MAG: twin-arginine translocase TatA/TatE family subunit [Smithella sp.]|jgi:sec-independent protein translocase protein TatA
MFEGLFRPMHILVILGIVLIVFGPGKLSEIGSSLGKSIRGFKNAMKEPADAIKNIADDVKSDFKNIDKK